ncbi:MAG: hypothetical protein HZA50_16130 [Planctomycetes bacterium]|nr:hypothetical protein [Planctomycetota bacterium]
MAKKLIIELRKSHTDSSHWSPLEAGSASIKDRLARALRVMDGAGRIYVDARISAGRAVSFRARGAAGVHRVLAISADGGIRGEAKFLLKPRTEIRCDRGPYGRLAGLLKNLMCGHEENRRLLVDNKVYNLLVTWGRDHTYTLKAMKYFMQDVKSGIEFFLDRQQPNGMFWDDVHSSLTRPAPNWFCEALGKPYYDYSKDKAFTIRRIPVEADVEYLYTECVWHVWKATGDDAWMARQLPRLEKALRYNGSHPTRWSRRHGLVKRSFCMDSWDFANPHFCKGDARRIHPGDPQFLFHGDNSGFYASHWRMAEMFDAIGNPKRAAELRQAGEALRKRANARLFFRTNYGHMIPETLSEKKVYALVGDERRRMSLSTGYTINRGLPTHAMAVKILREYQRRGRANRKESFAEWWAMDPMYEESQWPGHHGSRQGHYMNGSIGVVVAGELARAAFDHGMEEYGVDILRRLWALAERDGGYLHSNYRRLPENPAPPRANFTPLDLRPFANVGLRHGEHRGVDAWMGEPGNDMRNLPTGRRRFGNIEFDVIDPASNAGRAVVRLHPNPEKGLPQIVAPAGDRKAGSIYFMHAAARMPGGVAAIYSVRYCDGTEETIYIRGRHEIGLWWGLSDKPDLRHHRDSVDRDTTRVAWQGANNKWKNVGLFMYGWANPHPGKSIAAICCTTPAKVSGAVMLAAISLSDGPVEFETEIRSGGWPECWSQSSAFHAIAQGLAGIEDKGRAFDSVEISPRWAATESAEAEVTLHYPASDGYCAYHYRLDRPRRRIILDLTGSFERAAVRCMLPKSAKPKRVVVEGRDVSFKIKRIERSVYVEFAIVRLPHQPVEIRLA